MRVPKDSILLVDTDTNTFYLDYWTFKKQGKGVTWFAVARLPFYSGQRRHSYKTYERCLPETIAKKYPEHADEIFARAKEIVGRITTLEEFLAR
jgi:hypothetical protein